MTTPSRRSHQQNGLRAIWPIANHAKISRPFPNLLNIFLSLFTVEQIRDLVTKSSICTRSRLSLKNKKKAVKLSTRIFWLPLSSLHSESSVKQETSIASRPIAVFRTRHFVGMQSAVNFVHVRHDSQVRAPKHFLSCLLSFFQAFLSQLLA